MHSIVLSAAELSAPHASSGRLVPAAGGRGHEERAATSRSPCFPGLTARSTSAARDSEIPPPISARLLSRRRRTGECSRSR